MRSARGAVAVTLFQLNNVTAKGDLRAQRAVLAGRRQGGFHLGTLPDPGSDLFLEQPVHAGGFEDIDLGLFSWVRLETRAYASRLSIGTTYETPCSGSRAPYGVGRRVIQPQIGFSWFAGSSLRKPSRALPQLSVRSVTMSWLFVSFIWTLDSVYHTSTTTLLRRKWT